MSLNWDLRGIDRDNSPYWADPDRLDSVTTAIIWLTMATDPSDDGVITAQVAPEFFARAFAWERTRGAMFSLPEGERLITWSDVQGHIGLRTNVFPRKSRTAFVAKTVKGMRDGWMSPADPRPAPVLRVLVRELLAAGDEIVRLETALTV